MINTNLNPYLAALGTKQRLGSAPLAVDIGITAAPLVSSKGFIGTQVNATFFDPELNTTIPYTPVETPLRDDAGKDF